MKKISNFKSLMSARKGFTLIELLIVIAVLGILAAVILVAIDPVEQLARGRDSTRKGAISEIGRALQIYYTTRFSFPAAATWNGDLVGSGEIKSFPGPRVPSLGAVPCTAPGNLANSTWCYKLDTSVAENHRYLVLTKLDSRTERNKGTCGGVFANTWYVYASSEGQAGTYCSASEPTPLTAFTGLLLP